MARTLKLILAYDGTQFSGWQIQRNAPRTVQAILQRTLKDILGERVTVMASGRTDAGVHALAQVAHLKVANPMPCWKLQRALTHYLPPDLAVTKIEEALDGFHAQFDAKRKRYVYRIVNGPAVLPFERPYVHQVWVPLNVARMRKEAAALKGRHNFRSFQAAGRQVKDPRRTIHAIRVTKQGSRLTIEVEADGFLYNMVRNIVGTLLEIGRGRLPPGTMRHLLRARDRRLAGPTAPARGLCLVRVQYSLTG